MPPDLPDEYTAQQECGVLTVSVVGPDGVRTLGLLIESANHLGAEGKRVVDADFADAEKLQCRLFWMQDHATAPRSELLRLRQSEQSLQAELQIAQEKLSQCMAQLEQQSAHLTILERTLANGRLALFEIPDLGVNDG